MAIESSVSAPLQIPGDKAKAMGVNIFPGFPAVDLIREGDQIKGVITGDMGLDKNGDPKEGHELGYELRAKQTVFAEGCRGSLGKKIIASFELEKTAILNTMESVLKKLEH
ncbi:MAG: hypothetical protein Ct9H90mP13_10910 [Pseudomonadota bacterium]|nr:MAG: hypothetical protein Ct9H90mP13_10910 [Pseudomonadota bacterium]